MTAACSLSFGLLFCCESYSAIVVVVCDWITNASPEIYSVFVVVGETENQWLWHLFTFKVTRVDRAVNGPLPRLAVATCVTQTKGKSQSKLAGGRKRKQQQT